MNNLTKILLGICLYGILNINLLAKDNVLFLPKENTQALRIILDSIKNAKNNIKIAMYAFKYKKIATALKLACNKGVAVYVIFDNRVLKAHEKSQYIYLQKQQNIKTYTLGGNKGKQRGKLHAKYMIIDNKKVLFGSLNYTKKSFKNNYEVLFVTSNKKIIKKFISNFEYLLINARSTN